MAATVVTVLVCVLVADFITGLAHWLEDTYAVPTWPPPLDTAIAIPNIEHHRTPGITHGFFSRNWPAFSIGAIAIIPVMAVWGMEAWPFMLTATLAAMGNEIHTWNHRTPDENNALIRFLQDTGIVQTRHQHGLHHRKPYDRYYCTLTNFTNAVLERIGFWRSLEWMLWNVARIPVKRGSPERDGF